MAEATETATGTETAEAPEAWAEGAEPGSERILSQDEIDSLLGFDLSEDEGGERTGKP